MTTDQAHRKTSRADRASEGGYVAVMTALLLMVLMGVAAFAVDVGHWYLVGQQEQRAADAGALAGVTSLPADLSGAKSTAQTYTKINGFQNGGATTVTPVLDGAGTRLRVTVTQTVTNFFGSLMGVPTTNISRTAVADYAGPVPLGSPCNEFGDDPDVNGHRSSNCSAAAQFWANVGSPQAPKGNGDAYQNDKATNTDYDSNGYFYSVTVRQTMNLTIQAFDPALIDVGDACTTGNLANAKFLSSASTVAIAPDPSTRYVDGTSTTYCTGDIRYGGTGQVATQFTVRSPGPNPWDPMSFPAISGCAQTFAGYTGDLKLALDKNNAAYTNRPDVAANFRQWKTLCTINGAPPGTYLIQVKTNSAGGNDALGNPVASNDAASGHNRFSLRAYGSNPAENDAISVAGFKKMAMYANTPNGVTRFYLAKVPSGAKGQLFNVSLWDIGDGAAAGSTVTVLPPAEITGAGATFGGCNGAGVQSGPLTGCRIDVSSSFNAQWETISVPIPSTYACTDASNTGCWVRLQFDYGAGSKPADTTSWTASIQGDPVRLVE